jgi:hypothetical protein
MSTDDPLLLIDDQEVDLGNVWVHAQDDPYPGGHRYCLRLPESLAAHWMSKVGLEPTQQYDHMEYLSRHGLFWLDGVLAGWRMQRSDLARMSVTFVINTISKIIPIGLGVEVHGVCSPFVRGHQSKSGRA